MQQANSQLTSKQTQLNATVLTCQSVPRPQLSLFFLVYCNLSCSAGIGPLVSFGVARCRIVIFNIIMHHSFHILATPQTCLSFSFSFHIFISIKEEDKKQKNNITTVILTTINHIGHFGLQYMTFLTGAVPDLRDSLRVHLHPGPDGWRQVRR